MCQRFPGLAAPLGGLAGAVDCRGLAPASGMVNTWRLTSAGPALLDDPSAQLLVAPLIERAAFMETTNIAWALIAVISIAALAMIPFARIHEGGQQDSGHHQRGAQRPGCAARGRGSI